MSRLLHNTIARHQTGANLTYVEIPGKVIVGGDSDGDGGGDGGGGGGGWW